MNFDNKLVAIVEKMGLPTYSLDDILKSLA